ncbi:DUF2793 domain-containing protein [Sphingomicrobium arenosum]|uniref:DUF2793 domain-containing protein n=1 Tax=Sphingomicrobium arenosum TaxID=2233861 RepID=UPI002240276C|nr:DUF2793 domain-containing protein [Sphingomicrobium arenosum]
MNDTNRLGLPLLATGQAQKDVTHNEALVLLDLLVQPVVNCPPLIVPPSNPIEGECYLVAPSPSGAFVDHGNAMATYTGGGWRFVQPTEGFHCRRGDTDGGYVFRGNVWAEVGGETHAIGAAISSPAGGGSVDAEARAAIDAILAVLRDREIIAI